jgi:hypothetical protein
MSCFAPLHYFLWFSKLTEEAIGLIAPLAELL